MPGALEGIRIVEFAGIGPGPFAGMMLADHGADVVRIERTGAGGDRSGTLARSRRSIGIDMKRPEGVALVRDLCRAADGLIEGFRPGVMERLGLGPDVLLGDNPKLIYGRVTGWGQTGPLAHAAGHDINYIALSGVLHTIGVSGGKPVPPVNYLGDFGGGGMLLAFGMVSALLAVRMGGEGQVIDAAMTDGAALIAGMTCDLRARGQWRDEPGVNLLDGGAHFYDTYECSDGRWVAIGSIEPQFYARLRDALGLTDDPAFDAQLDPAAWPVLKARLADIFRTRTRDAWCEAMEGTDICFAPVLSLAEAPAHPHNKARGTFLTVDGKTQPAPAPRFSVTPANAPRPTGDEADALLNGLNYGRERIAALRTQGIIG
ncbi:MAG: CoA transferase [Sphingomonadaceae bacterium]|nr:CoA transferase [Sphingomonadaceae bacterium]